MYGTVSGGIMAAALFCFFQICGLCLAGALFPREGICVRLLLGSVLGSVTLQWLPALCAFPLGFTVPGHLLAAVLEAFLAAGALLLNKKWGRPFPLSLRDLKHAAGALLRHKSLFLVLALWGFYGFLVLHSFVWRDGMIFSSQATYGDMSMHLSFITSLARQGVFPPEYSLLPGTRLSYPFLSDSISSSLYLSGSSLRLAYCLPMLAAGAQVFCGGWLLLRTLSGGAKRGILAFSLFFFNGGLGILYFLGGGPGNFTRIFTAFYETPTNYSLENIRWVNVVVDMLLPQRATLFGWALLFPTLYLLYRAVFSHKRRYFLLTGLLAGSMPMIHTHSFLALALVCGAWLTVSLCRSLRLSSQAVGLGKLMVILGLLAMPVMQAMLSPFDQSNSSRMLGLFASLFSLWAGALGILLFRALRGRRRTYLLYTWGALLMAACALALPQLFTWTFRQVSSGGMLRGHFGWVIGEDNYLWFYLKNLGPVSILALIGLLRADRRGFARYCPAMAIWFVAEFVEFQPNDYDNNKLLYVGFLFLCCAAADSLWALLRLIRPRLVQTGAALLTALLLASPALLTMARESVSSYEIYGTGAMNLSQFVDDRLPRRAVILTDQRHNNELAALSGRSVVCGSPIYLFYHGLNYYPSEQAARSMYEEPEKSRDLFDRYHVDYVLVSDFERSSYSVDLPWFEQTFPKEFDDGGRVLYRVDYPRKKTAEKGD